jgi:hypothetical protein
MRRYSCLKITASYRLRNFHYFLFWALHTRLSICVKFNRPWCSHACLLFVIVRKEWETWRVKICNTSYPKQWLFNRKSHMHIKVSLLSEFKSQTLATKWQRKFVLNIFCELLFVVSMPIFVHKFSHALVRYCTDLIFFGTCEEKKFFTWALQIFKTYPRIDYWGYIMAD